MEKIIISSLQSLIADEATMVMALSIALTKLYPCKKHRFYFSEIFFGNVSDDEDGYFVTVNAIVRSETTGSYMLMGSLHMNQMLKNPTNCVSFSNLAEFNKYIGD